jgi:cytochrome c oxidase subunit 2
MDLIANRINYTWIDPKEPGVYVGNCSQYCGTEHALMLLRVIADKPDDFKTWTENQQKPAAEDPQVAQARDAFGGLACVNCHMIRGTPAVGKFGPDLTHLMSRQTIGSGVLVNDKKGLHDWVNDPQNSKPGCFMPSMKLTNGELDQVVSYLQSLK